MNFSGTMVMRDVQKPDRARLVQVADDPRWKAFDAAVRPAEFHMTRAVLRAHLAAVDVLGAQIADVTRASIDAACAAGLVVLRKGLLRAGALELPRALRAGWDGGVAQMRVAARRRSKAPAQWLARLTFSLDWPELATYLMHRPRAYAPIAARSTVDQFRVALVDGVERGLSIADLRREIIDLRLPEISKARATLIARTETISASNAASGAAYAESGVVERRRWLATRDPRTRDTHRAWLWPEAAQVRRLDQPFVLPSGARLMFPGDVALGAPASEFINCRCTTIPEIDLPGLEAIA